MHNSNNLAGKSPKGKRQSPRKSRRSNRKGKSRKTRKSRRSRKTRKSRRSRKTRKSRRSRKGKSRRSRKGKSRRSRKGKSRRSRKGKSRRSRKGKSRGSRRKYRAGGEMIERPSRRSYSGRAMQLGGALITLAGYFATPMALFPGKSTGEIFGDAMTHAMMTLPLRLITETGYAVRDTGVILQEGVGWTSMGTAAAMHGDEFVEKSKELYAQFAMEAAVIIDDAEKNKWEVLARTIGPSLIFLPSAQTRLREYLLAPSLEYGMENLEGRLNGIIDVVFSNDFLDNQPQSVQDAIFNYAVAGAQAGVGQLNHIAANREILSQFKSFCKRLVRDYARVFADVYNTFRAQVQAGINYRNTRFYQNLLVSAFLYVLGLFFNGNNPGEALLAAGVRRIRDVGNSQGWRRTVSSRFLTDAEREHLRVPRRGRFTIMQD